MDYRINSADVVSEIIKGEAVLINLATGNYYSLVGTAVDIWELLFAGHCFADITAVVRARYEVEKDALDGALVSFLAELNAEGLVIPGQVPPRDLGAELEPGPTRPPFTPPRLEVFSDLRGFLLVDPIHEVGEAGWPHQGK